MVGFSQEKNKKVWCKISVMWIDASWDNYILPVQSFHDYWNEKKSFSYSKFWVIGLCIVMSFLCFIYQGEKKDSTTICLKKIPFKSFYSPSSPAHQNSSRWQINMMLSWYRLVCCLQLLDFFFSFPLGLFKKQSNRFTGESSLEEGEVTQKDQYSKWQTNSVM